MPSADLVQTVRSTVEKNIGIPAILDAYGQFVDSPIGELELSNLDAVFSAILENLRARYPQVASQKAASSGRNDVSTFLLVASRNSERVKEVLKSELQKTNLTMSASIWERFPRANPEEKRAIDATLRLLRRSPVEIMFRAEAGSPISASGNEFEKFFAAVRSESPGMRELRYQNLIVEKAIFNKLVLKSKNQDYAIWVPSFFAKENVDELIERTGVVSEHVLLSRLRELEQQGRLESIRPFLAVLVRSSGVIRKDDIVPQELSDFVRPTGDKFSAISPMDLDDIFLFFHEERNATLQKQKAEEEKIRVEETSRAEAKKMEEDERQRKRAPIQVSQADQSQLQRKSPDAIYLGKEVDLDQFAGAITRRESESELNSGLKVVGEYYTELSTIKKRGVSIVGSFGSGKSTSLKRLLDGIGSAVDEQSRVIIIDPKGEHRGIAWKFKWKVFALAGDSQAEQFRMPLSFEGSNREEQAELLADILQEWCAQSGVGCSNQERARLASVIRSVDYITADSLAAAFAKEPELAQVSKKLLRNLLGSEVSQRMFSEKDQRLDLDNSSLFDISGRGLRNPTTKEERHLLSIMLLKNLEVKKVSQAVIVLEDMLDRFKSEGIKKTCLQVMSKLESSGNSIIATSKSQIKDFVGEGCLEIVHRLSGEKTITEEISGLKMSQTIRGLSGLLASLPRGYALVSERRDEKGQLVESAAVRVESLQFRSVQE